MSGTKLEIAAAEAKAAAAKARLQVTTARLKARLNPTVRVRETWDDVRLKGEVIADDALEFAYERPQVVAGIAGAGLLFLVRRPIARLLCRVFRRRAPKWDAAKSHSNAPAGRPTDRV